MRLHDLLDTWAVRQPDAELVLTPDRRLTYRDALRQADRLAARFIDGGARRGDRVAVVASDDVGLLVAWFAASKAGMAIVPIARELPAAERAAALLAAQPRLILNGRALARVRPATPGNPDALAQLPAGPGRAAVLTHRAVTAAVAQASIMLRVRPGERTLLAAPLRSTAIVPGALATIASGGSVHIPASADPSDVLQALAEEHIQTAVLPPHTLEACVDVLRNGPPRHFGALRTVYYTGAPVSPAALRCATRRLGCDFVQSYGLTEATHALTFLSPADHRRGVAEQPELLLSAGRPAPGTEVRIAGDAGLPLPAGAAGEIVARGPQLMSGYWERPAETATVLRNGWLRTGDAGYVDAAGYLYVRERLSDVIPTGGGEPVSPRLVEERLLDHPAIADAAVIGVRNGGDRPQVTAVVVVRPRCTVSADEVIAFCGGERGERPQAVEFVRELPRGATGRLRRDALRARYGAAPVE
jgi:acyl-CoA synthetase (AMP-forming)/AMP-acid ligase II